MVELEESKVLKKLSAQDLELIEATNNLSLNIIKARLELNNNENFLFSPVSVGMALGMIHNGVGQNEQSRIQEITGMQSLAQNEINKSYNEFLNFIQLSQRNTELFCANSMWFSYGLDINENYRSKLMAYYDAEISELNFGKKTTLQYVNNWGAFKTKGNLPEIASKLPEGDRQIYLINAFGLKTSWENVNYFYSENQFTGYTGQSREIKTVNLDQTYIRTFRNGHYDLFEIPLQRNNLVFSIIRPDENVLLDELTSIYSFYELLNQRGEFQDSRVNISIPDMVIEVENQLKTTLAGIGLQNIFTSSLDLSPSFPTSHDGISEIKQVASISISGQSPGLVGGFSNPQLTTIYIDRPFLYFVSDRHTQSVIFAGYYSTPE